MVGTVLLFVLGLAIMILAGPVTALIGAAVFGAFFDTEYAPIGFILGWIIGVLIALGGVAICIFQVIAFVQEVSS